MTRDEAIRKAISEWYDSASYIIYDRSLDQDRALAELWVEFVEVCEALDLDATEAAQPRR